MQLTASWPGGDARLIALCSVLRREDLLFASLLRRDSVFPAGTTHSGVSEGQETLPGRVSTVFHMFLLQNARNTAGLSGGALLLWTRGISPCGRGGWVSRAQRYCGSVQGLRGHVHFKKERIRDHKQNSERQQLF